MTKTTTQRYHHGNLRNALVELALELLETQGPDQLTLRGLASAAGVSRAAPYAHFADKNDLLAAVAVSGFEQLAVKMRKQSASPSRRERFLGIGRAYVTFAVSKPNLFKLMFGAFPVNPVEAGGPTVRRESYQIFDSALQDFLDDAREESLDRNVVRITAWSCVHGLSVLLVDQRLKVSLSQRERMADSVTALFAEMLVPSSREIPG